MRNVLILALCAVVLGCQTGVPVIDDENAYGEPFAPMEGDKLDGVEMPAVIESGLTLSPEQRFADIPLPVGLDADHDRTFIYEGPSLRIGRMVYLSRASVNELAQFYIRQLPIADWKRVSIVESEGVKMVFAKDDMRLVVLIRDRAGARGRELILSLTPREGEFTTP